MKIFNLVYDKAKAKAKTKVTLQCDQHLSSLCTVHCTLYFNENILSGLYIVVWFVLRSAFHICIYDDVYFEL